mmetsp:Transcript_16367/g.45611  ORF Transcript_16367/g.45611 Transcript_16367/m.45611 type:complete len:114 (+) Transcript_16367:190-531(+)
MTWLWWGNSSKDSAAEATDGAVLRESRQRCYQARDSFYECCEKSGSPFTAEQQHPSACRSLRKQYEASCKPSWVKHFDRLKDKEVRVVRVLHSNINERATTSKGNLAGETLSK